MGDKKFVFMMFGLLALLAVLLLTIDSPSDKGKKTLKHKTANNVEKKVIANPKPVVKKLPVKPADLKVKSVEKKVVDDKKIVTKKVENKSLEKAASDKIDNELLATYKWGRINAGEFIEYYNKLDSMKKVSLAKKSLFTELLKFFVQIQVSYNLALDQGYQNRLEVKIPINQQEQWFVVEKTVFENVQAKNEVSETEIKDYYEKIKLKDYKIEPGVDGVLISSSDLTVLQKIKKDVENGMKLVELKKKNLSEYKASIKELKLVRKGQRGKEFDKNVLVGNFLGCSKIFSVDGSNTFFNVTKRNPSGFRPFDNVKPYLTTKLKSLKARGLYDKFLLDLTQKYSAKIDSDFLKEVSSFCRTKLEAFKGRRLRDIIDNDFDTFYKGMQKSIPEEFKKKVLISIKGNDVKALEFVNMCFVIPAFYSTKGEKIDEYIVNLSNKMRDQEVLYREGINAGYDKDKILLKRLEGFKRDIITNEYTRKLLRDYVDFSEERLKKYYDEHPKEFIERAKIKASHILVKTSEEIEKIKKEIDNKKISFDDAAKKFSTCPSSKSGGDLGWFASGRMTPAFEKAAFALKSPGDMSGVVKTNFGFHLIKLTEKKEGGTKSYEKSKETIKNIIHRKERKGIEEKVRRDILEKGAVKFADGVFDKIFYHLFPSEKPKTPIINDKKSSLPVDKIKPNEMTTTEEKKIAEKKQISPKTDKVEKQIGKMEVNPTMIEVAKLGKRVFTLQDFVENYAEIPFQLKAKYKGDKGIIKCLQDMLMEWSIYLDGVEQGLLETDRVKMMIENINKVITVQAIVKEYFEPKIPLNDGEVKKYYENNKIRFTVPEQIRIMEIVTGDETVALEVLGQLKKGADFGELVKKYSVARSKVNNGIVEFFPRRRNSEYFDKIAFALKKDEISGVIKDSNMFKIIKNIDRVEPKEKPFSEVKKFIEDFLKKDKKVKFIDDYIVELKKEYHFNANYENLKIVRPEELEKVKNEKLFIFDKGSMTVGEFFKQLDNLPAKMRNSVTPEKRKSILKSMENVFILYTLKDKLSPGMLKRVEKTKERKKVKAIASEVQAKKIKEIVKKIKISDKDILNYYEKNKEVYSVPAKRKARQILVKTEKEAQDVIDELKKGTDFVYLAKSRSIDKGSSTKGGDIGFVAENQVIKPLGKALIELDVGEISNKPIKTGFGYYILKVEDKVPGKIAELSKIRDRILAKLKRDAQFAEIDKWYLELSRKYKGTVYKTEFLKSWKRK